MEAGSRLHSNNSAVQQVRAIDVSHISVFGNGASLLTADVSRIQQAVPVCWFSYEAGSDAPLLGSHRSMSNSERHDGIAAQVGLTIARRFVDDKILQRPNLPRTEPTSRYRTCASSVEGPCRPDRLCQVRRIAARIGERSCPPLRLRVRQNAQGQRSRLVRRQVPKSLTSPRPCQLPPFVCVLPPGQRPDSDVEQTVPAVLASPATLAVPIVGRTRLRTMST